MTLSGTPSTKLTAASAIARLERDSARYRAEAGRPKQMAQAQAAQYDALDVHDDQFYASEAAISTAIAMAAVAALAESPPLLFLSWAFGAFGIFMGVCGFARLPFHPDVLSTFLG